MAADLLVLMLLLYKVLLVLLDSVLVLCVPNNVHGLQFLERVALARVGGAVEGRWLQCDVVDYLIKLINFEEMYNCFEEVYTYPSSALPDNCSTERLKCCLVPD